MCSIGLYASNELTLNFETLANQSYPVALEIITKGTFHLINLFINIQIQNGRDIYPIHLIILCGKYYV